MKQQINSTNEFGGRMFTVGGDTGRWVIAKINPQSETLSLRMGKGRGSIRDGGSYHIHQISAIKAPAVILKHLGCAYHEDRWCFIHERLVAHLAIIKERWQRRISEL
jgi:hypothetical protein